MTYLEQKPARPARSALKAGYAKHLNDQHKRVLTCQRKGWNCAGGHTGGPTRCIAVGEYSQRRGAY